ncbi:SARP family transcriptional regulator [Mangrovactinospora gilvigrisea]|uniref:SARP family transcriptional regulator n=1 Tax=Mangrovactinospora gilvigrisea TaxID=1428644 RepID=A0A1J7C735_9ACTN|nr:BTAD domain-containing putative transcriptional regulator [Mangrovactinospora gilvigrisea]OIV35458.1 SARP family transcriptional regulator [Mangrovactinospora gilvigrisea]
MGEVRFGVLGPLAAELDGNRLALRGPRHRAVLARLLVARGRVVPVERLVADLWSEGGGTAGPARTAPAGAVGALRTFVGDLRKVLEPDRPPRAPARLLVTDGPGYALRTAPGTVDARRAEAAVGAAAELPAAAALPRLEEALALWRGPAYADVADAAWSRGERARLGELRLQAVEARCAALLELGRPAEAVPLLDAHLAEHPWREGAWRTLALALYRTGRQGEALAVLRRAREGLAGELGLEPGPGLRRLEADILAQAPELDGPAGSGDAADRLWSAAAADFDRAAGAGTRARLESTVGLLRSLAVTGGGGLAAARGHRAAAVAAAEQLGDPRLAARVIGAYDVPANWPRSDDPEQSAGVVAAAERTLAALGEPPEDGDGDVDGGGDGDDGDAALRCRLLATVALETRGQRGPLGDRAAAAAERAVALARRLEDPALLAFALNGAFMQRCGRAGLAGERDALGAELIGLAGRHGLATFEVLGHLIRMQSRSAFGDLDGADGHAAAADRLAERQELPLAGVFTRWYRAMRTAASGAPEEAAADAYRDAAAGLAGAGMPGVEQGLLPLALLGLRVSRGAPLARAADPAEAGGGVGGGDGGAGGDADAGAAFGPYRPWAEPFLLAAQGRRKQAAAAVRALPEPAPDLLYEACCCLAAAAARELGAADALARERRRLSPAAGQYAAGSGVLTLGPIDPWLRT